MVKVLFLVVLCFASVISARPSMASDFSNFRLEQFLGVKRVYITVSTRGYINRLPESLQSKDNVAKIVAEYFEKRFDPDRCAEHMAFNPYGCDGQPIKIVSPNAYNPKRIRDFDPLTRDPGTQNVIVEINVEHTRRKPVMMVSILVYKVDQTLPFWMLLDGLRSFEIDDNEEQLTEGIRELARQRSSM